MTVTDPLAEVRLGPAESLDQLRDHVDPGDGEVIGAWKKGKTPVVLTDRALYLIDEGVAYRITRSQVRSFGLTRASDVSFMRWGLGLYLLALPVLFVNGLLAIAMALVGGGLVTRGFLSKAILVQVKDERVPPFVVESRRWKRIRKELKEWR